MIGRVSNSLQTETSFGKNSVKKMFKIRCGNRKRYLKHAIQQPWINGLPQFDSELGRVIKQGSSFNKLYKTKISPSKVRAFYTAQLKKLYTASRILSDNNFSLKIGHLEESLQDVVNGLYLRKVGQKLFS